MVLGLNTNDLILKDNLSLLYGTYILKYFKNCVIYFLMFPSPQTNTWRVDLFLKVKAPNC